MAGYEKDGERETSECRHRRRRRWMRKEKQPGDFPEENRCVSLLAEFKVLEYSWSCILIGTECVRCLLEGH